MEAGFKDRVEDCLRQVRDLVASGQTERIAPLTEACTADCVREVFEKMTGDV